MAAFDLNDLNLEQPFAGPGDPDHRAANANGERRSLKFQERVPLARYTAARVGGPADWLVEVNSAADLASVAARFWELERPFIVLGGGSNVLVSDAGVREVVVINRARQVRIDQGTEPPTVWAESGANFGLVARLAAQRGLSGLEWAAGIPGTVGGAVFGNAGAHGGDMSGSLIVAVILHQTGQFVEQESWPVERLAYEYRSSLLKRGQGKSLVLSAVLRLEHSTPGAVQARLDELVSFRRRTQPPGASMGSMFKNPPGDYAGRLIEAAGLKGARVGDAEISNQHANFFINRGRATAGEVYELIRMARDTVAEEFGVQLELEVELIGEWHI
jgi:UDP-N-acetylmuramate dehydrogenase